MRRLILTLALVASAATLGAPANASDPLQPGAYMSTKAGGCTFNFVYDGTGKLKGRVFLGTAAHCVSKVGESVEDGAGTVVGKVAFVGNAGSTADDYAFVEISKAHRGRVVAGVKGHPQYPTGVTTPGETAAGDLVQNSGYGMGFDLIAETREERQAVLTSDDAHEWTVIGAISFGDSGGPLVHIPTGKALGIESGVCIGLCTDIGPTVQGLLARAAARRFTVRLRTV